MSSHLSFLLEASAIDIAALIRARDVSAVEVVEACLARIEALDPVYRAYLTVLKEQALQEARRADAAVASGAALGALHGVPVNVKDAFLMGGTPTTVSSVLLQGYSPGHFEDATCVRQLRSAGAIILGKTNVGSGMSPGYSDQTRVPPPRNPWDPERTPGGSSSGSVVSLAFGMAYASVGTDLGGSIRLPAAFSGLVGLKPTYGRASQAGDIFGMAPALEHVGPLARTVSDTALMLNVLAGYDARDHTSVRHPVSDYLAALDHPRDKTLRLAWASKGGPIGAEPGVMDRVTKAIRLLSDAGFAIEEVDLPAFREDLWYEITMVEEWEAFDEVAPAPQDQYLAYVHKRLHQARNRVTQYLEREMAQLRHTYGAMMEPFDLLALPTAPITAQKFTTRVLDWPGGKRDVFDLHLANTWMFNVTGHPAISLPCGLTAEGLPVGLQLVGKHFREETVLTASALLEEAMGGFPLPPLPSAHS